jgi:ArsR family transcriptional regulator, arsenate/arsenite/antimonite-responsive transcriptional repressor / arsenate reductase (thioredoxin)
MESNHATEALTALGHPGRLAVFRLLARRAPGGVRPGEMIAALGLKPSTLSVYLAALERAGLIVSKRDGKSILYRIDLNEVGQLIAYLVADCCRGRPELCLPLAAGALQRLEGETPVGDRPFNVLFICTGNSARSIMAESILRKDGVGSFRAYSAGSRPKGAVNPFALKVLQSYGYPVDGLASKSWDEFVQAGAPRMDFVLTVCDNAAGEACPLWPGQPITAHWGIEDPAAVEGSDIDKERAFVTAFRYLKNRVSLLVSLPTASQHRLALESRLQEIGRTEGSTSPNPKVA